MGDLDADELALYGGADTVADRMAREIKRTRVDRSTLAAVTRLLGESAAVYDAMRRAHEAEINALAATRHELDVLRSAYEQSRQAYEIRGQRVCDLEDECQRLESERDTMSATLSRLGDVLAGAARAGTSDPIAPAADPRSASDGDRIMEMVERYGAACAESAIASAELSEAAEMAADQAENQALDIVRSQISAIRALLDGDDPAGELRRKLREIVG